MAFIILGVPIFIVAAYLWNGIQCDIRKQNAADQLAASRLEKNCASIALTEARRLKVQADQQVLEENRIPNLTYQAMKLQEQIDAMRRKAGKKPVNYVNSDSLDDILNQ